MSFDPKRNKCKCFACGVDYDTFDLIGIDYGLSGNALFLKAYDLFDIQIDRLREGTGRQQPQGQKQNQKPQQTQAAATAAPAADFMGYFKECTAHIGETDYLQKRGISPETAGRFRIGFDPHYTRSTGGKEWKALIIPTTTGTFVARNTDSKAGKKDRYRKVGSSRLYNTAALRKTADCLFITEGEIDALSIEEVGETALALGSTTNKDCFLKTIEEEKPVVPLILL